MIASTPDIAVVIPTRNRGLVLREAIASVLAQSHANFELIVVDDASNDQTAELLARLSDPRIVTHRFEKWRHAGAARNYGARLARAPIISFLDSDDLYLPHRLESELRFFAENPAWDVRVSSYQDVTAAGSSPARNPEARLESADLERYLVAYCIHLGGSGIAIRKDVYTALGGFDEGVFRMQDREFLLRVSRHRGAVLTADLNWVKRRSPDSLSHQATGQLTALSELCRRHPVIRDRYPLLFRYLAAREIIGPVLKGRLGQAWSTWNEGRANPELEMSTFRLPCDYLVGKRLRQEIRTEMRERYGTA